VIETFALTKRYGDKVALDGLSLRVEAGEVLGFLGPNGSGKTTTIRLLMGLLRPTAGRAEILGRDCHAGGAALKSAIGYLPDEPYLYPYLSGGELLRFVAGLHGYDRREAARRAGAALERFGLADAARGFTVTYSHGMRKRLALAAALLHDPQVLILDEPTNGLDPRGAREMRDTVAALAAQGKTIFMSTHLLDVADKLCTRVAIVRAGALRALGTPAELRARYAAAPDASLEELFLTVTGP
jgi:ABC-2 type transport system ATP-binding protein